MSGRYELWDAVVLGGGFYGSVIAAYLAEARGMQRILLVEREHDLFQRASYNNQARVHQGYHYPRDVVTANRSRINFPSFIAEWSDAINVEFTKIYAIANTHSRISARQFERFCAATEMELKPAPRAISTLFNPRTIERSYIAREYAFDSKKLRQSMKQRLKRAGVTVRVNTTATGVLSASSEGPSVTLIDEVAQAESISSAAYVFNCTYSGINQLQGDFPGVRARLKHQATEMACITPPTALHGLGITVMDGPFFSLMPFPASNTYTLSHVRYTPHQEWMDSPNSDPYQRIPSVDSSRVERMLRDAARYVPSIAGSAYLESLFEIKTVLLNNASNDGRPILFERHESVPGCYSILGGKIDNIYDILHRLDAEPLPLHSRRPKVTISPRRV